MILDGVIVEPLEPFESDELTVSDKAFDAAPAEQPDEPLHYFQNSTAQKRGLLHPSTAKALTDLLTILAEEGENRAFSVLRQMVKSDAYSRKIR